MNQTTTAASMSRPIHVIGARLLINSESGNFDLLGRNILLLISHRATEPQRQKDKNRKINGADFSLHYLCASVALWLIINSLQPQTSDKARQSPRDAYPRRICGAP